MRHVERLPFTVYDIVGYFFPGAFLFFGTLFLLFGTSFELEAAKFFNAVAGADGVVVPRQGTSIVGVVAQAALLMVTCYGLGHVIAYVGARSVEKIANEFIGYPSQYMAPTATKSEGATTGPLIVRILLWIIYTVFCPIVGVAWIATMISTEDGKLSIHKVLPGVLIARLDSALAADGIHRREVPSESWFKFVDGYVSNNYSDAAQRMYNYVVVYGFLRNSCVAVYLLLIAFALKNLFYFSFVVSYPRLIVAIIMLVSAILLFLAFVKFYRRYSEEAIVAYATTDRTFKRNERG